MAVDVTDLLAKYQSGKTSFYLTLGTTKTVGNVSSFRIEEYQNGYANPATQVSGQSPDVPRTNPGSVTVTLTPYATITPASALDNAVLTFTGSGSVQWSPETRDSYYGGSAMQSGNAGNGDKSAILATVLGPCTLSFWWKTSTQSTDVVHFYVDSANPANASGSTAWTNVNVNVASGTHTIKWEYAKDAATAGNQDLVLLDQVQTTSVIAAPSAPTGLAVTVSSGIQLNWTTPLYSGGSPLTSYWIYRGTSAGTESFLTSRPNSTMVFADANATINQTYYYQVTARNAVGESPRSNEASGKIVAPVPSVPTSVTAVAGLAYIDLSWSSNGVSLTGFHVYRGTATGQESLFQTLTAAARTFRDSTVTAGTTYYYRIDAFNALTSSLLSSEVSVRVPTVPSAPTALTAIVPGAYVHLSWTAPADNGGTSIIQYSVYRGTSPGTESATALGTAATTSYDDASAIAGAQYYYIVRAINSVGPSAQSNEAVTQIVHAPDSPTSLSAVTTLGHVTLTWNVPLFNGGSPVTYYKVFRGNSANQSTQVQIGTATIGSYDDTQINVGLTYYYSVKAVNVVGDSVAGNVVSVLVKGLPGAPGTLYTQISDRTVTLTWSAPASNGYSAVTGYKVYRSGTTGAEAYLATVTGTTYADSGLLNGNVYYYRVSALNAMGEGPQCPEVHDSPGASPSVPVITSAAFSSGSVGLAWSSPDNGGRTITGYSVYRGTTGSFPSATLLTQSISGNSYQDATVVIGCSYYYFVTAHNSIGTSIAASSGPVFISAPPSAPTSVTALIVSGQVQLVWSAPGSVGSSPIVGYNVYRSLDSRAGALIVSLANVTAYNDPTTTLGQTYYYTVSAQNQAGSGPLSSAAQVTFVLVPDPPLNLVAIGSIGTAGLSWTAPDDNGGAITGYAIRMWTYGGIPSVVAQVGPGPSSVAIGGLTDGVQYWFSVSASNSMGEGYPSASATCLIGTVPGAPTGLTTSSGKGSISISWGGPVSNGGLSVLAYQVWRSSSGASTLLAELDGSARSYTDGSVVPGTVYVYTVTASNAIGVSAPSVASTSVAANVPSVPSSIGVSAVPSSVLVSWSMPGSNGGLDLTGFDIYRFSGMGWTLLCTVGAGAILYQDRTVQSGVTYQYSVSAINPQGEGPRTAPSANIVALSAPDTFSVSATVGNSNVTLGWSVPASYGTPLLPFTIVRTDPGTGAVTTVTVASTEFQYVDTTVTPGHDYVYAISASNAAGTTSAVPVTVHALRTVMIDLQVVPFHSGISVIGTVTDASGHGVPDQKVTIYRSTSLTGAWGGVIQLTTSSSGGYSTMLNGTTGIVRLRASLSGDGTHIPITIDRTVSSLRLDNGDMASITTNSTMSDVSVSGTGNRITFTLEQSGTANISIPKGSISDPGLIDVLIDGKKGNYQVIETGDQYVFSISDVKAGQIVAMSIGERTSQDAVPMMIELSLFLVACLGAMIVWRRRKR